MRASGFTTENAENAEKGRFVSRGTADLLEQNKMESRLAVRNLRNDPVRRV